MESVITTKSHIKAVTAGQFNKEKNYLLNKLSGELVKTGFPYDFKNKTSESRWESCSFQFKGDICTKLMKLSNNSDIR